MTTTWLNVSALGLSRIGLWRASGRTRAASGLEVLRPADLRAVRRDGRVVAHVLGLERRDANAAVGEDPAQRRDEERLAGVARAAHDHDRRAGAGPVSRHARRGRSPPARPPAAARPPGSRPSVAPDRRARGSPSSSLTSTGEPTSSAAPVGTTNAPWTSTTWESPREIARTSCSDPSASTTPPAQAMASTGGAATAGKDRPAHQERVLVRHRS